MMHLERGRVYMEQDIANWLRAKLKIEPELDKRYVLTFGANTSNGDEDVTLDLDLVWFALIHADDTKAKKLQIALSLLQEQSCLQQFNATLNQPNAALKRLLAEFLLYNVEFIDGLKKHIDFTKLNAPIDFVSLALFINHAPTRDKNSLDAERLYVVSILLDTGFKLDRTSTHPEGAAIRSVLLMETQPQRFAIAKRLLDAGFSVFNKDKVHNAEIAVLLINNRNNLDCKSMLKSVKTQLKNILVPVHGSKQIVNLADYYYWVKEDMPVVKFIKTELGIDVNKDS